STGAVEPLTVSMGTSSTATTIENYTTDAGISGAVPLGTSVDDSSTVTGTPAAFAPTGTVTYNFYTNATATGTPAFSETLAVGSESEERRLGAAGGSRGRAAYGGESNDARRVGGAAPFGVIWGTSRTGAA